MKGPSGFLFLFVLPFGDALFMVRKNKRNTCGKVSFFVSVFLQIIISAESLTKYDKNNRLSFSFLFSFSFLLFFLCVNHPFSFNVSILG